VIACVCVSVCLSVCPQDNSRTWLWMSIKLGMARNDAEEVITFGIDPIPDVDPESLFHYEIRHFIHAAPVIQ